jgi:hypothetical protein
VKFVEGRPLADPDAAARKLMELANAFEPVQDGRIYIEKINGPFLFEFKGTPAECKAGLDYAIAKRHLCPVHRGRRGAVRLISGAISRSKLVFFAMDRSLTHAHNAAQNASAWSCVMPRAPSIVPDDSDREVYLVLNNFGGQLGLAWRETDDADTDLERLIEKLLAGQYTNPVRIVAFNTAEGWSRDVTEDIARELRDRCAERGGVPAALQEFLEHHGR